MTQKVIFVRGEGYFEFLKKKEVSKKFEIGKNGVLGEAKLVFEEG